MTERGKINFKHDLLKYSVVLFSLHTLFLIISGYFSIGLLSDDYLNFISAQTSTLVEKFTSSIPYYSNFHFRPVWFLSINLSIFLNSLISVSDSNFIFYRIENLLLFYLLIIISANLLLKISGNKNTAIIFSFVCLIFPNNLINICWTAGKVDILCGIFLVSALSKTYDSLTRQNSSDKIFTLILFSLALMTKETAVTFPFICIIFFLLVFGKDVLSRMKTLIFSELTILSTYIFFKIFILKNSPAEVITAFQDPGITGILNVIFKATISLIIPFDYLTIQYGLHRFDFFMILYLLFAVIFFVYILYLLINNKEMRSVILLSGIFLISVLPNLTAGYFRPQLILIPFIIFSLTLFIIISRIKGIPKSFKYFPAVIFSAWVMISFNLIKDWEYASEVAKTDAGIMCKKNFDFKNKKNIYMIGLPSRYNQSFLLNYASGPYNYYCNNEFKLTDKISDIIHTGALDKISLNSDLKLNIISQNEFEIKTTGVTQYLLKLDLIKNEYSDKDIQISFSEFNSFNKPTKAKVRMLSDSSEVYLFSKDNISKVNLNQ